MKGKPGKVVAAANRKADLVYARMQSAISPDSNHDDHPTISILTPALFNV